jgi:transcriptional regulator with XRE-family HTH domain
VLRKGEKTMTFYTQLKAIANQFNLSLNHIERDLGYPRNTLCYYRNGGQPKVQRLLELAAYFDVSLAFFLEEDEKLNFVHYGKVNLSNEVQRIKYVMRENKVSVADIAQYTGIKQSELSDYLFSKRSLDKKTYSKIWEALGEIEAIQKI